MNIATKIMIIRHAEKPADSGAPYGVAIDGRQDPESLTPQGWQRAGAIACLFAPTYGSLQSPALATPQVLYASGIARHSNSRRPQQTIAALSQKLGITIDTTFAKGQEQELAQDVISKFGVVLICWEHQDIPLIASEIMGSTARVPLKWPDDRFDVVWIFDLDRSSGGYRFSQVPQCLLSGDQPAIIQ